MTQEGAIVRLNRVGFRWPGRASFALNIDEFALAKGERLLLLGESGSGKSTLLSLIAGVMLPDMGQVQVAGSDLMRMSGSKRDQFRAEHIGVIFQQFNLLPFGSVADNIALPLRFAPKRRARIDDVGAKMQSLCTALNLPVDLLPAKAGTLSVGQQQRVAVARALIGSPDLIIADEPTSALDAGTQSAFLDLLFSQMRETGQSLLMVSHDARLGAHFDRVIEMADIIHSERMQA